MSFLFCYSDMNSQDMMGHTPLFHAAKSGYGKVVDLLLECSNIEIDLEDAYEGQTPLSVAAMGGFDGIVQALLARGAEIGFQGRGGRTPLSFAAEYGRADVVKALLASGANANKRDDVHLQTPLMWAELNGHDLVIDILQEHDETM
jgi:ankyrin repeat protein